MPAFKDTKITLFDGPSTHPDRRSLSGWCWRARLVLNFKGLAYTTQFVEIIDLESTLKPLGVPPTGTKADGSPHYTVPAIIDATDSTKPPVCISDSQKILLYLEETYPDPSRPLIPSTAAGPGDYFPAPAVYLLVKQFILSHFVPYIRPLLIEDMVHFLSPRVVERMNASIVAAKGEGHDMVTESSIGKEGSPEKEACWKKLEDSFGILAELLETGEKMRAGLPGGPGQFFMGHQVTYADFSVLATLLMIHTASESNWKRVAQWHGGRWERLRKALEEYIVVI
ncbi:hypothetical protein C8Q75DRAFT_495202 [Abortiporus biennis]|nr:hypothetical protein C8Q75DRAFT_495202 [Abortiporus biennis]